MNSKKSTTSKKHNTVTSHRTHSTTSRKLQRKTTSKRKNVSKRWEVPLWLYYVLMGIVAVVFVAVFYYFFIRPYAYRWKPCYGLKGYGVCMPYGYNVHGLDISHYQGDIDWQNAGCLQKQ